jgi:2-haloacid dehalogenase
MASSSHATEARSLDFSRFRAITFDCYGTLIDWETGLLAALRGILGSHAHNLSDAQIFEIYSEIEPQYENPYRPYRDVLAKVARAFAERLGFSITNMEAESLPQSLKHWLPFPDTNRALKKLGSKYKLAIVSNTDDALFAATARHLAVDFDEVVTAEQAQAYKPSAAPFQLALDRMGLSHRQVLHAGQSVYHDVLPAQALGMATVLVHRRGFGATRRVAGQPDLRVPDLETLAELAVA